MKGQVATPDQISAFLADGVNNALDEQNEKLRLYRSRARLTPHERQIARGIELEKVHRRTPNADGLAEALAMQGRYDEASGIAVNPELKLSLTEKAVAVAKPDCNCKCDDFVEAEGFLIPTQFTESYGHSLKHNQRMPFIRCTLCGDLNARALPEHIAEQKSLRNNPDATDAERLSFFKI